MYSPFNNFGNFTKGFGRINTGNPGVLDFALNNLQTLGKPYLQFGVQEFVKDYNLTLPYTFANVSTDPDLNKLEVRTSMDSLAYNSGTLEGNTTYNYCALRVNGLSGTPIANPITINTVNGTLGFINPNFGFSQHNNSTPSLSRRCALTNTNEVTMTLVWKRFDGGLNTNGYLLSYPFGQTAHSLTGFLTLNVYGGGSAQRIYHPYLFTQRGYSIIVTLRLRLNSFVDFRTTSTPLIVQGSITINYDTYPITGRLNSFSEVTFACMNFLSDGTNGMFCEMITYNKYLSDPQVLLLHQSMQTKHNIQI